MYVCDVDSWKSRGLQNKQAACLRLPCDVTTGQTRDEGRREKGVERESEREREREERDAHQVKTGEGMNEEPKVTEVVSKRRSRMNRRGSVLSFPVTD